MTGDKRAHAGNKSSVLEMLKNELDRAVKKDVLYVYLVKKYGGRGGLEQGGDGSWGFEPCARGWSCNFQLPLGGGSSYL